jgi:epoxyqueuosine reductase
MSLTQQIKEEALYLGFTKAGVTTADDFPEYIEVLEARPDTYAFYTQSPRNPLGGARPRSVFAAAKSIISVAYDYSFIDYPEKLLGKIGRIYQARCYLAPPSLINGARLEMYKSFLSGKGCTVLEPILVPDRMAAARAGVATFGDNNFAYVDDAGSFLCLSSIVVDVELEYDTPTMASGCPPNCRKCIDACPTGALVAPRTLVPRRCIPFNNWSCRYAVDEKTADFNNIPGDVRERMGTIVHGCDICQEVCPRNRRTLSMANHKDSYLEKAAMEFDLAKMLNMDDAYYQDVIRPLMYNYINEKKYFQRNAAIALGNTGDEKYLPDLAKAMRDKEEVVREYSAWGLGRIGGAKAKGILEESLIQEKSQIVRRGIASALQKLCDA